MKQSQLGVPAQALWELLEYTPQQITRFDELRTQDQFLQLAAGNGPRPDPTRIVDPPDLDNGL